MTPQETSSPAANGIPYFVDQDTVAAGWDYAHILRLIDARRAAREAYRAAPTVAALRAAREASEALEAAKAVEREAFATSRGWRRSNRSFTVGQLRSGHNVRRWNDPGWIPTPIDHPEYFRQARCPWRPVAIVSHEYSPFASSLALAAREGLRAELLPASWYFPGQSRAVLYTASLEPVR